MKKIVFLAGVMILVGGCGKMTESHIHNGHKKLGLTREELMMPQETEKVSDEFSGSVWTGTVGEEKFQVRFDAENNSCQLYREYKSANGEHPAFWHYERPFLRTSADGNIMFDCKPYIDYAASYSMEACWLERYEMFKTNYEISKKIADTATDPEKKKKAKEFMTKMEEGMKLCETFESFKSEKEANEAFKQEKNYHAQRATALKAINPVQAVLSDDKKTLTVSKILLSVDRGTGTPKYAENVVFTRE